MAIPGPGVVAWGGAVWILRDRCGSVPVSEAGRAPGSVASARAQRVGGEVFGCNE